MREIKFRAWDKENKEMVEVELLGKRVLLVKDGEWENIENFVVMQYTGLKDNNGAEIYEGDILTVWIGKDKQVPKYAVEDMRVLYFDINRDDPYYAISQTKIIGNIYENPELLGAERK